MPESLSDLPLSAHPGDRRLVSVRKAFHRKLRPGKKNSITPSQPSEVHPIKRFSSFLTGEWEGDSVCNQADSTWLPWGQTSLRFSVLASDSGLINVKGKGLSEQATKSIKVKYTVTGSIDLRTRQVVLQKARADRSTFYHTTHPTKNGHFPTPSLILHQQPGLDRSILKTMDNTLVGQKYEGELQFIEGAVVIKGLYQCGSFTIVKKPSGREQKEVSWAGKCLGNTTAELKIEVPVEASTTQADQQSQPPDQEKAEILNENSSIGPASSLNTDSSPLMAYPVDYQLLNTRTHPTTPTATTTTAAAAATKK